MSDGYRERLQKAEKQRWLPIYSRARLAGNSVCVGYHESVTKILNIIGPGRVGRTLGALLQRAGLCAVQDVLSAEIATAESAAAFIGAGRAVRVLREMRVADFWLLTPPDGAIASAAAALAATGQVRQGDVVFHCSGSLPSTILAQLAATGVLVASAHPLKSFADPVLAVQTFKGTYCAVEGDAAALQLLKAAGLPVIACTLAPHAVSIYEAVLPPRAAVLVGAEGPGLTPEALAHADLHVRIPMHGAMDSLNVATAAAVVMSALAARAAQARR